MDTLSAPQRLLLAAIDAHRLAPVRITRHAGVRVGGHLFALADLHVLRARKLVRRGIETEATPAWLHAYAPTEAGDQVLDIFRVTGEATGTA